MLRSFVSFFKREGGGDRDEANVVSLPSQPTQQYIALVPHLAAPPFPPPPSPLLQVSPTYAIEISGNPAIAPHLEKFYGIRNGIDPDIWDPAEDKFLPRRAEQGRGGGGGGVWGVCVWGGVSACMEACISFIFICI